MRKNLTQSAVVCTKWHNFPERTRNPAGERKTKMKRKTLTGLLALLICLSAVIPALAANTFLFTEKTVTLYEGETYETALRREGTYTGDGEVKYASTKESVATISEDGTITAVRKGDAVVTASLVRNGKRVGKAQMTVKVLRPVKKVTLNTTKLSVYDSADETVAWMLKDETDHQIIVIPAGKTVTLSATCTPEDASSKKVTYTSSDAGVAKIAGVTLRAVQRGECDLTVASAQNPEVTETFRVLVIQPVKKITIQAGDKTVAAGSRVQLSAVCSPDNASIQDVVWSSKDPSIAEVDRNGRVTGRKRGSVNITATAADGSGVTANVFMTVTQPVSSVSFSQKEISVVAGRAVQARVTVEPANASDRTVTWSSSDESIATVKGGLITGHKAGTCTVTCASHSNPEVTATATVTVVQLVTKIECTNSASELSLKTGETGQLFWKTLPEDATNKNLTYRSLQPKIASVDENGVVKALSRGTATIVATAQDQGKRQGSVRVNVIQPATGVEMKQALYYVQRGRSTSIRAVVQPRNANNQKVHWSSVDEGIATVRSNGTSTGSVYGVSNGTTTVTAFTDDGGFTASTKIRVGNFNEAVMVEELYVDKNNKIRIALRNMSRDLTLGNVHFVIECFDTDGNPMICNKDGKSTSFEGNYPFVLDPLDRTSHGSFRFKDYVIDQPLGAVILTVTSWRDADGYTWRIPEDDRVSSQWTKLNK